jgi:hypothetical protein
VATRAQRLFAEGGGERVGLSRPTLPDLLQRVEAGDALGLVLLEASAQGVGDGGCVEGADGAAVVLAQQRRRQLERLLLASKLADQLAWQPATSFVTHRKSGHSWPFYCGSGTDG